MHGNTRFTLPIFACLAAFALAAFVAPEPQSVTEPVIKPGLAVPPARWAYLPELASLGAADIFHIVPAPPGDAGSKKQMSVHIANNVGILTRDVDVLLSDATTLNWRWKVDQVPSRLPEAAVAHHDYFSIAVKFENGRDLTYMWSSSLPEGLGFDCPLPGWTGREFHVVIRSGPTSLGKWLTESRHVAADYAKYVGGQSPGHIVQVWFIANTIIQHSEANASFGDMVLTPGRKGTPLAIF